MIPVLQADRQRAESYGAAADRYDRPLPTSSLQLLDEILGPTPVGLSVLDIGCGIGIAARLMAARGAEVLAVEVDTRMPALARGRGTPVEVGAVGTWSPA